MKTAQLFLLFFLFTITFISCKKDKDDEPAPQICRVTKVNYTESGGAPIDSAFYTYTGDNVSKVQIDVDNYTIEYTGDKISKRNYFSSGSTTSDGYDQTTYNSDGTISKIEFFTRISNANVLDYRLDFTYTAGKLTKVTYSSILTNVATKEEEYNYTYTGNNITSAAYTDFTSTPAQSGSITYTYDANTNYLKKQNSQSLLVDPFFTYFTGFSGAFLPMVFSNNNMITAVEDNQSYPISYTLDSKQNLGELNLFNQLKARYSYLCQ
jgi:hypothetical protein